LFNFTVLDCNLCGKVPTDITFHESSITACKPRSLVIKPSFCTFANYSSSALLHCGISNSQGSVYNFDSRGVCMDKPWDEVLHIPLIVESHSDEKWDLLLQAHYEREKQLEMKKKYHQLDNNCYDFVVRFLNEIQYEGKNNHTKEDLVVTLISGKVDSWDSFHQIYKKISENGVFKLDPAVNCTACSEKDLQPSNRFHCLHCSGKALCAKCKPNHDPKHKLFPVVPNVAYRCDGCNGFIIEGNIFRCVDCKDDYDLCPDCYSKKVVSKPHQSNHTLTKVSLPLRLKKK